MTTGRINQVTTFHESAQVSKNTDARWPVLEFVRMKPSDSESQTALNPDPTFPLIGSISVKGPEDQATHIGELPATGHKPNRGGFSSRSSATGLAISKQSTSLQTTQARFSVLEFQKQNQIRDLAPAWLHCPISKSAFLLLRQS